MMFGKHDHKVMAWDGTWTKGDAFRGPDGRTIKVEHTGLTMDQCQRIAYKEWKDSKR